MLKADDSKILQFAYRGAPQTIDVMRKAALSSQNKLVVRQLAEEICSQIDSKDYVSEYLAIYNFILQRTRYMRDPRTVELVKAPYVVAEEILAKGRPNLDCDDLAATLGALILSIGGSVRYVTVAFGDVFHDGKRQYSHVFVQAREPRTGLWIILDPVAAERTQQMIDRVTAAAVWPVA